MNPYRTRLDVPTVVDPIVPPPEPQFQVRREWHSVNITCENCNTRHTINAGTLEEFVDARVAKQHFKGDCDEHHEIDVYCRFCQSMIGIRTATLANFVMLRDQLLKAHQRCERA